MNYRQGWTDFLDSSKKLITFEQPTLGFQFGPRDISVFYLPLSQGDNPKRLLWDFVQHAGKFTYAQMGTEYQQGGFYGPIVDYLRHLVAETSKLGALPNMLSGKVESGIIEWFNTESGIDKVSFPVTSIDSYLKGQRFDRILQKTFVQNL